MEADDRHCRRCGHLQTGPMIVRAVGRQDDTTIDPGPRVTVPDVPRRPPPASRGRAFGPGVLVLGVVVLVLLIFAVGLSIGRLTSSPGHSTAGLPSNQQPPAVVTPTPSPTPTPTPTSAAHFASVRWDIPGGRCTSANGCPVTGTFRNQGAGRGEGTAKFEVTSQDGATVYASCTAPIPATDPGGTADASCSANSPDLVNLWHENPGALITVKPSAS